MAEQQRKQEKSAVKAVKKKWYRLLAPKIFGGEVLGESLVAEPGLLSGRVVEANLMNLTGDIKQQTVSLKFRVCSVSNEEAATELISYEVAPVAVKRFVRRAVNRIDESFMVRTSDSRIFRIKPFVLTRTETKGSVRKAIRRALISSIMDEVRKFTFDDF